MRGGCRILGPTLRCRGVSLEHFSTLLLEGFHHSLMACLHIPLSVGKIYYLLVSGSGDDAGVMTVSTVGNTTIILRDMPVACLRKHLTCR